MLTITATNFGLAPADIQMNCRVHNDLLILGGEFTVDTTAEEYAGIRPMQITFDDLPFAKSRVSTAIVTVESEGVKYATITKVWVSDMNTINIAKVSPYKSAGSYTVKLSTMLIPENITDSVSLMKRDDCVPVITKGEATGLEMTVIEESDWLMLVLKVEALTFDETDNEVVMTLPGIGSYFSGSFPVFYNEGLWTALGSKYYPASLQDGILTIRKDGNADEASNTGNKFTRILIVPPYNRVPQGDE